jgi:GNAT superfamily N-acetyltransferase
MASPSPIQVPPIRIVEDRWERIAEHARIPIAFEVRHVLEIDGAGRLAERAVATPWVKDYDAIPGDRPTEIARHFDVRRWGILAALVDYERVGGAIVAFDTPGVDLLEGRRDLAVVWDLRVAPAHRGKGVAAALWDAAEAWAAARGCVEMKVETQDVNVPACRFYESRGCTLRSVRRGAYAEWPEEVQLTWGKEIGRPRALRSEA